jgi:CheY-like chemotaxis protein
MLSRNHSILIVDNVSERREQLKAMLFEREDSVIEADTSEAALELMKEIQADLIITETELPTRSGLYLLQEIKKLYPDTEVILTTHNASSFNLLQALRHGAFDFIVRPIDTSEILFNIIDKAFTQIDLRVHNQALLSELENRNKEMERSLAMMTSLSEAIEKINSAMEVSELLSRLLDSAMGALQARKGLLALICGPGESPYGIKMSRGVSAEFVQKYTDQLDEGLLLDIARSGSPMVVSDTLPAYMMERVSDEERHLVDDPGLLAVPLYHRDRAIGVMILFGYAEGSPFTAQNLQFLVQLAHHAAITLEKAGIIHQLKRQGKKAQNE